MKNIHVIVRIEDDHTVYLFPRIAGTNDPETCLVWSSMDGHTHGNASLKWSKPDKNYLHQLEYHRAKLAKLGYIDPIFRDRFSTLDKKIRQASIGV